MRRKATRIEQIIAGAARSGGCVHVRVGNGTPVAELWFDAGSLVAAAADGGEHRLGARLVSTGHLAAAELDRCREQAAAHGVSLALTLSERVRRDVIGALARDEARYAFAAALAAPQDEVEANDGLAPPGLFPLAIDAGDLLVETHEFLAAVREAQSHAPATATPIAAEAPSPDLALGTDEWALLSRADGTATVAMLADECGFPQAEAALIVTRLAGMGLVTIEAGFTESTDFMAELEAAEDLAAISAAFEHAAAAPEVDAPQFAPEPVLTLVPEPADVVMLDEPAPPVIAEAPAIDPAHIAADHGDRHVDTQALLRELASIARQPNEKGL